MRVEGRDKTEAYRVCLSCSGRHLRVLSWQEGRRSISPTHLMQLCLPLQKVITLTPMHPDSRCILHTSSEPDAIMLTTAELSPSCQLRMQATETQSHKWYLYLRGLNNEDIGHIVKKVNSHCFCVFGVQPCNANPASCMHYK